MTPDDDYSILEGARAGDVVEVQPGTYRFRVFLSADGTESEPIIIRAADTSNPPVWDLSGMLAENFPGSSTRGDRGRGCWQVTGDHYQISSIVMQGCTTESGNAAGVRAIDTESLVLRDMVFRDNEVGLSGNGENTLVEHCEFSGNGRRSSPPQHNTYIYGGSITMRHNYMHDTRGGQNLHIRAVTSVIEYNWIARASNYEVDMMTNQSGADTQDMLFRGNVLISGESPENGGQIFALHNDSGHSNLTLNLRLIGNTIIVQGGGNPALINARDDVLAGASVEMHNNVVVGTNQILRTREDSVEASGSQNWLPMGDNADWLTGTITGASPGFEDGLGYVPGAESALVGMAAPGFELERETFGGESEPMRFRFRGTTLDIGAFEHTTNGPSFGANDDAMAPPAGDAGPGADAGGLGDAGSAQDAGPSVDSGPGADGGSSSGDAGDADSSGGCSAGATHSSGAPTLLLSLLAFVVGRRRFFTKGC